MKTDNAVLLVKDIRSLIHFIRGQRVILDAELAKLYGVSTLRFNQAVKRNLNRFPADFLFQLNQSEWAALISQIVISKTGRGGRRFFPYAFTEHGALMAANILRSPRAVAMSVYVIRAFVKMREDQAANAAILKRLAEIDQTLLVHDTALRDIYEKLRPLLAPLPDPPQRKIGFREEPIPYRVPRQTK